MFSLSEFINDNTEVDPEMIVLQKDLQQLISLTEGIIKREHVFWFCIVIKLVRYCEGVSTRYVLNSIFHL